MIKNSIHFIEFFKRTVTLVLGTDENSIATIHKYLMEKSSCYAKLTSLLNILKIINLTPRTQKF